jgi:hypothetical protein
MGIATLFSGAINYLYHPVMLRYLDGAQFGMLQ